MSFAKISQKNRDLINSALMGSINDIDMKQFEVGDSVKFKYKFKKINITNEGVITKIINRSNYKSITVFSKKAECLCKLNLCYPGLSINLLSKSNKKYHKSNINYLYKKYEV